MAKNIVDRVIQYLGIPQNSEEFQWTKTQLYQRRLERVKSFWIIGGVIMLAVAQPAFILAGSFFLTFLSFAFL